MKDHDISAPIMTASKWLDQHGDAYQGRWVALKEGELIGDGGTLKELESVLHRQGKSFARMFVTKVLRNQEQCSLG